MAIIERTMDWLRLKDDRNTLCSAVIVAAGESLRMGAEDKLFIEICGEPVLAHTLMAFQKAERVSEIVVVAREECLKRVGLLCRAFRIHKAVKIMAGGETRLDSAYFGAFAVSENAGLIAIHDGARPCVSDHVITCAIVAAARHHAAAPGLAVSSTMKRAKGRLIAETVDREGLFEIQTPQVFDADLIRAALTKARKKGIAVTDDCQAAELIGVPVYISEGSRNNIKITTGDDLVVAEAILRSRETILRSRELMSIWRTYGEEP